MTRSMCVSGCQTRGFKYAGLQHGTQCHCANELNAASPNWRAPEAECSAKCGGDANQKCGGSWRMGVYAVDSTPASSPSSSSTSASSTSSRAISTAASSSLSTSSSVISSKTSSTTSGTSSSTSSMSSASSSSITSSRSTPLTQSSSSSRSTSTASSAPASISSTSRISSTSVVPSSSISASSTAPSTSASASSMANDYIGCYVDQNPRSLRNYTYWTNDMTPQKCRDTCKSRGFEVSGTSNAKECFCGDSVPTSKKVAETECSSTCAGDKDAKCGGWWRLSVYAEGGQAKWASASAAAATTGAAPQRRSRVRA